MGESVTLPGFRIGVSANGRSFVQSSPGTALTYTNLPSPTVTSGAPVIAPGGRTHGPMLLHGSVHAGVREDELTAAMSRAVLHTSYVPFAVLVVLASLVGLVFAATNAQADFTTASLILIACAGIAAGAYLTFLAWQRDQAVKIELKYVFDPSARSQWDAFCRVIASLGSSGVKVLRGAAQVYDPKYHSGANQLVDTKSLSVYPNFRLRGVVYDVKSPAIEPLGGTRYVFLPDRIISVRGGRLSRIEYGDVRFEAGITTIIENSAPRGATIVGHSWRYTNRDGGPDRRFKDNYQLPIVQYAVVRMTSAGGMDHSILFVSHASGSDAIQSLKPMAGWQATYERIEPVAAAVQAKAESELRRMTERSNAPAAPMATPQPVSQSEGNPFAAAFDAVCCVVFADGSYSAKERDAAVRVLVGLKAPWTEREIVDRMEKRLEDVKARGIESLLLETRKSLVCLRAERQQAILKKCLQDVAKADGQVAGAEKTVYQRLIASLPPVTNPV